MSRFSSSERQRRSSEGKKTQLNFYRSVGKSQKDSPFEKKKKDSKSKVLFSRTVDMLLALIALIAIAYVLIIRPQPKVDVSSTAYHPASDYYDFISSKFKSIKDRNKVTFDEGQIISDIKNHFPEVHDASVSIGLISQTPDVAVDISEPSFILNSQQGDYIVDSEGTAVAGRLNLPNLKNLPVLVDQTGFNASLGKQVISSDEVKFINQIVSQLKISKVPVATMTLPPKAQELDLRTKDSNYYTKFYLGGDSLTQIGQFLAARNQFVKTKVYPAQYLDVRVNGKIYYR